MHERDVQRKQYFMAKCFGVAAPLLLVTGFGLDWWKERFYGRSHKSHRHPANGANGGQDATEASSR